MLALHTPYRVAFLLPPYHVSCLQLLGALAWFWLIVPVVQSAWVLSKGLKRAVGPHMLLVGVRSFPS